MLAEKIYALRKKNGLSQEQLAEKVGVSRQAVSKWEGGWSTPDLDKLKALCEAFGVSMDELTGEPPVLQEPAPQKEAGSEKQETQKPLAERRAGLSLCLLGAGCLFAFLMLNILQPDRAAQLAESSVLTLNGTGMLLILFVLFIAIGLALLLKKK